MSDDVKALRNKNTKVKEKLKATEMVKREREREGERSETFFALSCHYGIV